MSNYYCERHNRPEPCQECQRTPPLAPAPGSVVAYHDLPLESPEKVHLKNGHSLAFNDGRTITVWKGQEAPGVWVHIKSPLPDGKESLLRFRLSDEAAIALSMLLGGWGLDSPNS